MASGIIDAPKPTTVVEQFLRLDLFIPELRSHKKASVLEEMVGSLARAGVTRNPEVVLQLLYEREALGSTAIGKGVAVPHGRSVLRLFLPESQAGAGYVSGLSHLLAVKR